MLTAATITACGTPRDGSAPSSADDPMELVDGRLAFECEDGSAHIFSVVQWSPGAGSLGGQTIGDPVDVGVDASGSIHVLDGADRTVKIFTDRGHLVKRLGPRDSRLAFTAGANGLAVDPDGNIYVWDRLRQHVVRYSSITGTFTRWSVVGAPAPGLPYRILAPDSAHVALAIAVDDRADRVSELVRVFASDGSEVEHAGPFLLRSSLRVTTDGFTSTVSLPFDLSLRAYWTILPGGDWGSPKWLIDGDAVFVKAYGGLRDRFHA